jgi:hypothetical protein
MDDLRTVKVEKNHPNMCVEVAELNGEYWSKNNHRL